MIVVTITVMITALATIISNGIFKTTTYKTTIKESVDAVTASCACVLHYLAYSSLMTEPVKSETLNARVGCTCKVGSQL